MSHRACILALLITTLAQAEESRVVTYPPGDDKISVVRKGEAAPYAGQLFDDATALRWATWLQQYKALTKVDSEAAERTCSIRVGHEQEVAAVEAERNAKIEEDLKQRLKDTDATRLKLEDEIRNPPFFRQPGFWFGVGVAATLATAATTVLVVESVK